MRRWDEPRAPLSESQGVGILACMNLLDRISADPDIRFGKPCVHGTRITVGEVLAYLAGGREESELRTDFPQLSHEDVLACLAFAAERERRVAAVAGF